MGDVFLSLSSEIGAVRDAVVDNFRMFQELTHWALREHEHGRLSAAAAIAQAAAEFAWHNHAGLHVSSDLERLLVDVSAKLPGDHATRHGMQARDREHVVHVMTSAIGIGGHTRLAWRWMGHDSARRHSLVLTGQQLLPIPEALKDAVRHAGGEIRRADTAPDLLGRAARLRRHVADADVVVLHIHPQDVTPLLAFGRDLQASSPPIIFVNHADHAFWLGTATARTVVNIRDAGQQLAIARRGISASQCTVLPIPLDPAIRTMSRLEARRQLGIAEDTTVLLSVASTFKFGTGGKAGYLEYVVPLVKRWEKTLLLVVGPVHSGAWVTAAEETEGRIRAFGRRSDVALFYQVADIYLDSFPFSSLTSMLEAVSYGVAPLSLAAPWPGTATLFSNDPAMPEELFQATSVPEYEQRLQRLIEDELHRVELGQHLADRVASMHGGENWQVMLKKTYEKHKHVRPGRPTHAGDAPSLTELDLMIYSMHKNGDQLIDPLTTVQQHLRFAPSRERARLWLQLAARHSRRDPRFLLSSSTVDHMVRFRRYLAHTRGG